MTWLLMLLFSVGLTATGWRFRRIRDGRYALWLGITSVIAFAIILVTTTFFREAFYGWLYG